jgi:HEAT repeat protein
MDTDWELTAKRPGGPRKRWPVIGFGLVVLIVAWFVVPMVQRARERRETESRLRQIVSGDGNARRDGLEAIRALGPGAAPAVADSLRDPDLAMRRASLLASREVIASCLAGLDEMDCFTGLFASGRGEAVSGFRRIAGALADTLGDADEALRLDAVTALAAIPDSQEGGVDPPAKRAGVVLRAALQGRRDPEGRRDILGLLAKFRPTLHVEGASALVRAIDDEDEPVRRAARQFLLASIAQWGVAAEARETIRRVMPRLIAGMDPKDRPTNVRALSNLAATHVAGPEIVPLLVECLGDPEWGTRLFAARGLDRMAEDPRAVPALQEHLPALIAALDDPDQRADVRWLAAGALGKIGPAAAASVPGLIKLLDDRDPSARQSAADALGEIGAAAGPAIPALIKVLDDSYPLAGQSAARTLGKMGPAARQAIPALRRVAAQATDEQRRIGAEIALSQIGR